MDIGQTNKTPISYRKVILSRPIINLLFLLAMIVIVLINALSYKQVDNLISTNAWVIHTYQVIQAVDESLYDASDLEAHQRGYIISGDREFLADVEAAKSQLKININNLSQLTKNNSLQNLYIKNFNHWIDVTLNGLDKQTELKANNKFNTQQGMTLFNQSEKYSDQLMDAANEIKSVELSLLNERDDVAIH